MEFSGRILKVFEPRTGTSERTGNEWKTQGFIFEYFENPTDRFSDKVYLETFDEKIMEQLKENIPARIGFGHRVREYNNKQGTTTQINELRIYKFVLEGQQQPAPAPTPADGGTGSAPAASEAGTGDAPQAQGEGTGDGNDDLPF